MPNTVDGAVMRGYTRLVRASVRHRWITLFVGALIFAASLWSTRLLPSGFMPADDVGRVLLAVELPPGSRLDDTDRVTRAISEKLREMPEVRSALIFGGQILGGGARAAQGDLRHQLRPQVRARGDAEGAADADRRDARRPARHPLLVPQGQRPARPLADHRRARHRRHQRHGQPARQRDALDPDHRESDVDRRARSAGVARRARSVRSQPTSASRPRRCPQTIRVATLGDIDANLAKFNAGDRLVPIRVELDEAARSHVGLLAGPARSDRRRRDDAAFGGRRFLDQPRTDRDQPLRPLAAGDDRGRSARRRGARRCGRGDPRAADGEDTCRRASRSARPATSR